VRLPNNIIGFATAVAKSCKPSIRIFEFVVTLNTRGCDNDEFSD